MISLSVVTIPRVIEMLLAQWNMSGSKPKIQTHESAADESESDHDERPMIEGMPKSSSSINLHLAVSDEDIEWLEGLQRRRSKYFSPPLDFAREDPMPTRRKQAEKNAGMDEQRRHFLDEKRWQDVEHHRQERRHFGSETHRWVSLN